MLSVCPVVSRIDTPRPSLQLHYPCVSVHPPTLLDDTLGGRDRASLDMHFKAVIDRVWGCTWRVRSSELRDGLGGRDKANLDMHWEAVIE